MSSWVNDTVRYKLILSLKCKPNYFNFQFFFIFVLLLMQVTQMLPYKLVFFVVITQSEIFRRTLKGLIINNVGIDFWLYTLDKLSLLLVMSLKRGFMCFILKTSPYIPSTKKYFSLIANKCLILGCCTFFTHNSIFTYYIKITPSLISYS